MLHLLFSLGATNYIILFRTDLHLLYKDGDGFYQHRIVNFTIMNGNCVDRLCKK